MRLIVWQPHRAADTSTSWRQSLFCCCTASIEQAADGAETTEIDGLVLSWSENISVSFCLWAPKYGLTLWCALGLLVGASVTITVQRLRQSVSCVYIFLLRFFLYSLRVERKLIVWLSHAKITLQKLVTRFFHRETSSLVSISSNFQPLNWTVNASHEPKNEELHSSHVTCDEFTR